MLSTDTRYKAVDFVPTYTGRAIYPFDPSRGDGFSVIDIAHHLANQCRYTGAADPFYCTAQHSCILFDYVKVKRSGSPLDCLQILMHDSAEAYLVDMPRPIKQYMPEYRKWDHDLTMRIRAWLGLGDIAIPEWQDEVDSRIIVDERKRVMRNAIEHGPSWQLDREPLGVDIVDVWTPQMAEQQFLMRFSECSLAHYGSFKYLRSGWGVPTHSTYTPDFRTRGSDVTQRGDAEPRTITDLLEVDILGGVGRVALRTPDGMMIRDPEAGSFPRPAWGFIHGNFELLTQGA